MSSGYSRSKFCKILPFPYHCCFINTLSLAHNLKVGTVVHATFGIKTVSVDQQFKHHKEAKSNMLLKNRSCQLSKSLMIITPVYISFMWNPCCQCSIACSNRRSLAFIYVPSSKSFSLQPGVDDTCTRYIPISQNLGHISQKIWRQNLTANAFCNTGTFGVCTHIFWNLIVQYEL